MRIVIVGAGRVGTQLAMYLTQKKHDISVIESDEERAKYLSNRLDCMIIHDKGNDLRALQDAGIAKADALVCVTESDEVNMIICGLAAAHYGETGKLLKIARVRNDDYMHLHYSDGKRILGIDHFIHPGLEVARSIIKTIEHGVTGNVFSFSDTPYELGSADIAEGSAFDGLVLSDYRSLITHESLVTLVERNDEVMLPSGSTVLAKGDRIHILADGKNLPGIFNFAGNMQRPIRRIGIVGGGKLGSLIADGLLNADSFLNVDEKNKKPFKKRIFLFPLLKTLKSTGSRRIIIIEQDRHICNDLAARFPTALILNEDISDESFANDEELNDLDCLISTTTNQELNIITAVYMKSKGVMRTIALVTGSGHAVMARRLGIDVVIPMESVVVDSILSHLMGSGVKEVRSLGNGNVDLIEAEIGKDAPVIEKPISSFKLSTGGLIMLANRGGESFIPKGDYIFKEGDRIVLIARTGCQVEIEKYFGTDQ
jgi:trk system potassium uptake protein TrkA